MAGATEGVALMKQVGSLVLVPPVRQRVLEYLEDCDAYMAHAGVMVDRDFLSHARNLKVVGSPSTGTDHMDLVALKERGIEVFHIANELKLLNSFTATAEHAFGLMFAVSRNLVPSVLSAKQGLWKRDQFVGMQFSKKTLGILGLGRLGKIAARIGLGYDMRVISCDIREVSMENVEVVDFSTLVSEADVLQIHVHLNDQTRNLINESVFEKMKPGAFLINTSRGAIVNEPALLHALKSGQISGAGLDVIDGEWLAKDDLSLHPLIAYMQDHDNLVITPHTASSTPDSMYGARNFMARKIANYLRLL
jgi:D-3-phosphoglycerate dehydrogenase / 2-oxoglutarate reductase